MRKPDLTALVPGRPRPQGSLTLWSGPDGKERAKYSNETILHRNLIVGVVQEGWGTREVVSGAVALRCTFRFSRPKSHYGTGRNAETLKASAPRWMTGHVDSDKLLRAVGDAVTIAGVVRDDCQIVVIRGEKVWAERDETLVELWVM